MVGQWISGTDEKEKIERACEKENAYKNLLESFHDLDEEDKLEEIIKGVFELRDFSQISLLSQTHDPSVRFLSPDPAWRPVHR